MNSTVKYCSILLVFLLCQGIHAQTITRINGSVITADSLTQKINYLMEQAKVAGMCVTVFNNKEVVYKQAFGMANVPEQRPLKTSTLMYAASFSKAVFAYTVMQLVQDKVIDLDKPLVQYL